MATRGRNGLVRRCHEPTPFAWPAVLYLAARAGARLPHQGSQLGGRGAQQPVDRLRSGGGPARHGREEQRLHRADLQDHAQQLRHQGAGQHQAQDQGRGARGHPRRSAPLLQAGSDHRRHRLRHRRGEEPAGRHPAPDLPQGAGRPRLCGGPGQPGGRWSRGRGGGWLQGGGQYPDRGAHRQRGDSGA
ncbi:hypothetical protein D3C80_1327180 [compost metagenome]